VIYVIEFKSRSLSGS